MTAAIDTIRLYRWTIDEYHRLAAMGILSEEVAVELLDGQIVEMSPVGDPHAACVTYLDELLRDTLGKRYIYRIQSPVILDQYSEPEPDIALVRRKENFYSDGHPQPADIVLLIEVADKTLKKDRTIKADLYAAAGIPEYWIVNLVDRQVELHRSPSGDGYDVKIIYRRGQLVETDLFDPIAVEDFFPD